MATVRVGIIGTGWVGASVAISVLQAGLAQELLLHDVRTALAEGEAMDLRHGAAFLPAAAVHSAAIEDMLGADAIVIAAGRGGRPPQEKDVKAPGKGPDTGRRRDMDAATRHRSARHRGDRAGPSPRRPGRRPIRPVRSAHRPTSPEQPFLDRRSPRGTPSVRRRSAPPP